VIEAEAFRVCSSLAHLPLPDSLVKIDTRAFQGCTGLRVIELGGGVTSWGWYMFSGCAQTTKVLALRGPAKCENWSAQLIPALDPSCVITRSGRPIEVVGQLSADGNLVLTEREMCGGTRYGATGSRRKRCSWWGRRGSSARPCAGRAISGRSAWTGATRPGDVAARELPLEELATEGEFLSRVNARP
jgi:hypothetical protein